MSKGSITEKPGCLVGLEYILSAIFNISDPRTDSRISYRGGKTAVTDLVSEVDSGKFALAFILYPTAIEQLLEVADEGEVMPPKSTWFEPKFDVGLLIHQIKNQLITN